jgi:hypothetical protein
LKINANINDNIMLRNSSINTRSIPKLKEGRDEGQFIKDTVKDYETSDLKKFNVKTVQQHLDRGTGLHDALYAAFEAGEDPATAILNKLSEYRVEIGNSNLTDEQKNDHNRILEKKFNDVVKHFAERMTSRLTGTKIRSDSSNPMYRKREQASKEERDLLTNDIIKMFTNAKSHFDEYGSLDNLSSSEISKDSKTITYDDLLKFHDLKDVKEQIYNSYEEISVEYSAKKYEMLRNFMIEEVKELKLSSYSMGMFIDMFL